MNKYNNLWHVDLSKQFQAWKNLNSIFLCTKFLFYHQYKKDKYNYNQRKLFVTGFVEDSPNFSRGVHGWRSPRSRVCRDRRRWWRRVTAAPAAQTGKRGYPGTVRPVHHLSVLTRASPRPLCQRALLPLAGTCLELSIYIIVPMLAARGARFSLTCCAGRLMTLIAMATKSPLLILLLNCIREYKEFMVL